MPVHPSDDDLRQFLLGNLPPDRADAVQAWLDADPSHAPRLDRLTVRDPLTDACSASATRTPIAAAAVERVARAVSALLQTPPPDDTLSGAGADGTTSRPRPPAVGVPVGNASGWPPERLGQFRIVRELGHGGMGYVFEAEDEKLGRRVAVKVLAPELARRPDAAARFLREARAAAAVEHENVVPILHIGEHGDVPYIVMPLLKGESLAERLKREGALPAAEVVRIGRDVAAGLGAAHARGLVHRDVKPANVWLDAAGRARVLDFGLARLSDGADGMTDPRALLGTPAYLAPEQLDARPVTPQSDLFSLGATLYECATGVKAFDGPSITAILNAVNTCRPKPPTELNPSLPPVLAALIEKLLKKDPIERPADAGALIAVLGPGAGTPVGTGTTTATWIDPGSRPSVSRRMWLIGGAVAAVILGVAVWQIGRTPAPTIVEAPPQNPAPSQPNPDAAPKPVASKPVPYRGSVDVKIARTEKDPLVRMNTAGALPMRTSDTFRIECEVDPPAYLYLVWVDPDHDITPVYPWKPVGEWRGTRPAKEEPQSRLSLPADVGIRWRAQKARPGVATMVLLACEKPLAASDDEVEGWFKALPDLPLPPGGDDAVMWFDNYVEVKDPLRLRAGGFTEVESDAFARWQGQLKKSVGGREVFQTAVSFARTGRK
jgi:serine/threonine protein kinase